MQPWGHRLRGNRNGGHWIGGHLDRRTFGSADIWIGGHWIGWNLLSGSRNGGHWIGGHWIGGH